MVWLLVGYMWLFLHRPFEIWEILGTIRLERVYMLTTLVIWATVAKKEWTENRANSAIALVAFSITFSTIMSPFVNILDYVVTQDWLKMAVFYVLILSSVKKEKDLKILCSAFTVCFFLYMLHSYREYYNGRGKFAMGTWRMVGVDRTMNDPNTFGNSIVYALPMLLPLSALIKKKWQWLGVIGYSLLSFRCVQLTGSRSSLLSLGVLLFGAAVASKHRLKIIPTIVVCLPLVWFGMSENLRARYYTLIDPSTNKGAADSAAGRIEGFWMGVQNFQRSPIWGWGPECHGWATGDGFSAHQLYGQVMGELGLIGIFAYLALIAAMCFNHWEAYQHYKSLRAAGREADAIYCFRVSAAVLATLLMLLFLGLGGHNALRYTWVWYAAFQAIAVAILADKVKRIQFAKTAGIDPRTVILDA